MFDATSLLDKTQCEKERSASLNMYYDISIKMKCVWSVKNILGDAVHIRHIRNAGLTLREPVSMVICAPFEESKFSRESTAQELETTGKPTVVREPFVW